MNQDVPLIVMPDHRIPMHAPLAWYKRPLAWLGLLQRKPMAVWTEQGVLLANPAQVDTVVRIFQEEGFTVITGRARTPATPPDRARWAGAAKPSHNFRKADQPPRVTRPNLRPVPGGDK